MKHLQELYNQVSEKFTKLQAKKDEVEGIVRDLIKQLEAAEKNYDVETMEQITGKLENYKKVHDRIGADLQAYREKVNERDWLYNQIQAALNKDGEIEKANPKIQSQLKEIAECLSKLDELEYAVTMKEITKREEFQTEINKFSPYVIGKNIANTANFWSGYRS